MKTYIESIATVFILAIFFSFLVPLTIGVTYSLHEEKKRIETEFNEFQNRLFGSLERELIEAVMNLEPVQLENILRLVVQDPRIVRVKVVSFIYNMTLADLNKGPEEEKSRFLVKEKDFVKGGETVGRLIVYFDKDYSESEISEGRRSIIMLFAGMFICGMSLIIPIIYFKLIKPTARLMVQTESISSGNMDSCFEWEGGDELSRLGYTLDDMRQELKSSFNRIQELAVTDELTGMPNRRAFYADAEKMVALGERYDWPVTIALMDIDYFKVINDEFGHAVGDQVLQIIAQLIMILTRKTDICARYGGEEFVICLPETNISDARIVVEKIRAEVQKHVYSHGQQVTMSIGLAENLSQQGLEKTILQADQAMYKAKNSGRNRVIDYSEIEAGADSAEKIL
ncbi:sensor domain-containing diguanylate cyclase [Marinifilum sp. JC120]|nr:sensor domain-containing diguanylate cyclase [Marinifilum sp. JC120]